MYEGVVVTAVDLGLGAGGVSGVQHALQSQL